MVSTLEMFGLGVGLDFNDLTAIDLTATLVIEVLHAMQLKKRCVSIEWTKIGDSLRRVEAMG